MVFFLNLFYSIFASYGLTYIYRHSNVLHGFWPYFFFFTPIWFIWLILCGGQYNVGTDYFSYLEIFKNVEADYYYAKNEWIFAFLISIGSAIHIPPQGMFFVFYFINFLFFFLCAYKLDKRLLFYWIFLYITLSTAFNNQLNGLRQYTAIYIITYAYISFYGHRSYLKLFSWIFLASGIHFSSLLSIILVFLLRFQNLSSKNLYILLVSSLFLSVFASFSWLDNVLQIWLPPHYASYLTSEFNSSNDIMKIFSKLIFLPFYFLAVRFLSNHQISTKDQYLFLLGLFAYVIRMSFLSNVIFTRIGEAYILLSVLPLWVYVKYLLILKHRKEFWFITLSLLGFYLLKTVVIPRAEYSYQSIYFN